MVKRVSWNEEYANYSRATGSKTRVNGVKSSCWIVSLQGCCEDYRNSARQIWRVFQMSEIIWDCPTFRVVRKLLWVAWGVELTGKADGDKIVFEILNLRLWILCAAHKSNDHLLNQSSAIYLWCMGFAHIPLVVNYIATLSLTCHRKRNPQVSV